MAIALLDQRKIRFWDAMDRPVGELLRLGGMDEFLEEISDVRTPEPNTDWGALPLYHLVDHLTREHREFQLHALADMAHLLDIHSIAETPESEGLRSIHKAFQIFVRDFQRHIEEEEGVLFPRILRYEAALRDRRVHPEFHRGSVQSYLATRAKPEGTKMHLDFQLLLTLIRQHGKEWPGSFAAGELLELADAFGDRLVAHSELETNTLYPRAIELERNLYNLSIDGDPTVAFRRRGPMDSGILRLHQDA